MNRSTNQKVFGTLSTNWWSTRSVLLRLSFWWRDSQARPRELVTNRLCYR
jgi:hypothetical protein